MKENGVRQRVLRLVKEAGSTECPKEKILSKKCKDDKTQADRKTEEKCEWGPWSDWSECRTGGRERKREVTL